METQKQSISEVCVLAGGSSVDGNIKIASNLRLEGTVNGDVSCGGRLVLSKTALINGNVICSELISEGKIFGNTNVKSSVVLHSTSVLEGDISCTQLQIDNGASFNGKCTMHKKEA